MSQARKKATARDTSPEESVHPGWPFALPEQSLLKLLIELTEMWYSAVKKLTLYTIDATEGVAKVAVDGQRLVSAWAKDTPVAPLLEEQQHVTREFVARSADLVRRLWLLQIEQREEAAERAEEEMLSLTRAQA